MMELPILLAIDTTENWNRSDTVLGKSELAIEIAGTRNDKSLIKYLLIGDGKPTGPNAVRLRATPELIAGLPQTLQNLAQSIADETHKLQQGIDREISDRKQAVLNEENARKDMDKTMKGRIDTLVTRIDEYRFALDYLTQYVSDMHGQMSPAFIINENGAFFVTESGEKIAVQESIQ